MRARLADGSTFNALPLFQPPLFILFFARIVLLFGFFGIGACPSAIYLRFVIRSSLTGDRLSISLKEIKDPLEGGWISAVEAGREGLKAVEAVGWAGHQFLVK